MFVLRTIRCKHSRIALKWSPRLMIMIQLPVHKSRGKGRNHRKFISSSLNYYICSKSLKTYISWEEFGVTALKKNENCCLFLCLDDTKLPRTLYTRTGGVCVWYQKHKKVYNMKQSLIVSYKIFNLLFLKITTTNDINIVLHDSILKLFAIKFWRIGFRKLFHAVYCYSNMIGRILFHIKIFEYFKLSCN